MTEQDHYRAARFIMDQMTDLLDADTGFRGRKKVYFEYHFAISSWENDDVSSIRIKVGLDRLYQVKEIENNARLFLNEQPMTFGKEFTYDPAEHYVSTADREMLYFILDLKNYQFQNYGYYSYRTGNQSEIEVPPVLMKEVLKKLIQTNRYRVKLDHRDHDNTAIKNPILFEEEESLIPFGFEIKQSNKNPEDFVFSIDEDTMNQTAIYSNQRILLQDNEMYFLSDEEIRVINVILTAMREEGQYEIVIPKTIMKDFLMNSVPSIKKRFPLNVSEEVRKAYHRERLVPKMFLDWQEDKLSMNLEFHYGGQFYNPLVFQESEQNLPESILLDLEAEGSILNLLYDFEFPFDLEEGRLTLADEAEVYRFLFDALPEFNQKMEVYTTSEMEQILYTPMKEPQFVIDMNEDSNLLHITFDVEGIDEQDLKLIMKDLAANKKYRRLSNGRLVNLRDRAFQEYYETLEKMEISANQVKKDMEMPLHRIFSLDKEMLEKAELKNPVRDFLKQLDQLEMKEYALPASLDATLRPYQVEGYQWLRMMDDFGFGGILADDMGLGKTIQALTYIASVLEDTTKPILVVCPSSVLYNWQKEAQQFIPGVETALITGTKDERQTAIESAKKNQVRIWITSYPVLIRDEELYDSVEFRSIILDEAQIVKNNTAKTTKAVRKLKARNKFALSGTPLENQVGELYSIFSIVVPGLFSSQKRFKLLTIEELNQKIRPFILRRLKRDVLKDLPDKIETVEYVDLSEEQKKIYLSQLRLVRNETNQIIEEGNLQSNRIKILAGLTRLRQICCDPRLVMPDFKGESTKLERLMEYLETAQENGKRVVLFSQFTQMLGLIQERLRKSNRDYFYLDGSTPNEDRLALTTRFNEGEKDLFLISLKAGGTGLNLTGGDTVILYDSWWNPAVESQATDRVHRFGQKKMVQVIRMICTGTIEERINELQGKKKELIDQVISEGNQSLTSLSKDEILEILAD